MGTLFDQIQYVTTPFALAAFIAAAIVIVIRAQINRDRKLIQTASESDRARLVERVLGKVDTDGLMPGQRYRLALEDLRIRSRRFLISAVVIVLLAAIAATISIVALSGSHNPEESDSSNSQKPIAIPASTENSNSEPRLPPLSPPADLKITIQLAGARLIWPQSGVSDPSQYPAAGFPVITDDQVAAIRRVAEDQTLSNNLKVFFPPGSITSATSCEITFPIWDDGSGFPDRNSFQISAGNIDKGHVEEIEATLATVQFPTPSRVPFIPKLPGAITQQDIQSARRHISYFQIKVKIQVSSSAD